MILYQNLLALEWSQVPSYIFLAQRSAICLILVVHTLLHLHVQIYKYTNPVFKLAFRRYITLSDSHIRITLSVPEDNLIAGKDVENLALIFITGGRDYIRYVWQLDHSNIHSITGYLNPFTPEWMLQNFWQSFTIPSIRHNLITFLCTAERAMIGTPIYFSIVNSCLRPLHNGKILDQQSQSHNSLYISKFFEICWPVIKFLSNKNSHFHHSYPVDILILWGFFIYYFKILCLFS